MITFKCKMCGGDLHPEEKATTCECEFCGTLQTIPTADNEKKITLFNRAQRLLFNCEFDKAASVYESIVSEFATEAEAYWGLVLCKYGIEYVDDPATGKKIPTCHRTSFDSVIEDSNYEQALENTDPVARRVYRDEAKTIEELRKKIIEISNREDPFDIFICYKETDDKGNRTLDSVVAQDIYSELVDKGYKVFFSRITLEDKLGQEYEPYIFAALNSAKIMLVVGTDYEHLNSVWVKNEWGRFLKLIASGEKKTLIPCYKNIDAYDMPKEFAKLQAQDMGKVGAMQDLIRGIEKIISGYNTSPSSSQAEKEKQEAIRQQTNNYLQMAEKALSANNHEEAETYSNKVIEIDPLNYKAWIIKGKAAGWQSNMQNIRIPETITAFITALENAPEDEKEEIGEDTADTLKALLLAMIFVQAERFAKWPDKEEAEGTKQAIEQTKLCAVLYKTKTDIWVDLEGMALEAAKKIHEIIVTVYADVCKPYRATAYPDDSTYRTWFDQMVNIDTVLQSALEFLGEDDDYASVLMSDLRQIQKDLLNSCSYEATHVGFSQTRLTSGSLGVHQLREKCIELGGIPDEQHDVAYFKNLQLTDEGKAIRQKRYAEYDRKVNAINQKMQREVERLKAEQARQEKEAAQKRFDEYWKNHAAQRTALTEEKEKLNGQLNELISEHNYNISELNKKLRQAMDDSEEKGIEKQIEELKAKHSTLGIFKGKEKKTIEEQIEVLRKKKRSISDDKATARSSLQKQIDAENRSYESKRKPLRTRIDEIHDELTKAR